MEIIAQLGERRFRVNVTQAYDLALPVRFDSVEQSSGPERLKVFAAAAPQRAVYKAGSFVGSVAQGGSCNCETYSFTPHTSGTHTEGVGHLSHELLPVFSLLKDSLLPATVLTLLPTLAVDTAEHYEPTLRATDLVLTRTTLQAALEAFRGEGEFLQALVLRTLPNSSAKKTYDYDAAKAVPFFTLEAMEYIVALGVRHLLVDLPSLDRLDDGGILANHRLFWGLERGSHSVSMQTASLKTVTELIYVPDIVPDGCYVLNLQVAALWGDATPSRPLLYALEAI